MKADIRPLTGIAAWWWRPRGRLLLTVLGVATSALLITLAGHISRDRGLADLEFNAQRRLLLHMGVLDDQLAGFSALPALLSQDSRLSALLANPGDPGLVAITNSFLDFSNSTSGAKDIYLMDRSGMTLAASNWRLERTFVGRNFNFRPYFKQALRGVPGRYFALGTTSGERGYYFSSPILDDAEEIVGVLAVKIDVSTLEREWVDTETELLVTDQDGVVFISTRESWLYHSLAPIDTNKLAVIETSKRYPGQEIEPLPVKEKRELASGAKLIDIGKQGSFMMLSAPMEAAGWEVHLLANTKPVARQAILTQMLTAFVCGIGALLMIVYLQRLRRRDERARHEAEKREAMSHTLAQLEERVEQRTVDLSDANARLLAEIRSHEETRDELIQAAKLAALGQLSAGINHELNQPLAAIRTLSDNARLLIERDRIGEARENLQEIASLTEQMAQISAQLKVFSRKSRGERSAVSLLGAVDGSLRILATRIRETDVEIDLRLSENINVMADMVQLEQVLVNLLGNALNAVESAPQQRIRIAAERHNERVALSIHDSGLGIPEAHLSRIFDPFFTTRESGLGLGLSISHRIIERMEGQLSARNAPEGGACFTVELEAA